MSVSSSRWCWTAGWRPSSSGAAPTCDRLWSARMLLEDPDLIRAVHADYFAAGADVAISASYQASFEGFAERGLSRGRAAELSWETGSQTIPR